MKDKILITGSNGQLGQCFQEFVRIYKYKFHNIDTFDDKKYIFTTRKEFDITNNEMMKKYLNEHLDIKVIINCAAYTNVKDAETEDGYEKAIAINSEGVKNLAHLCKEYDIFLIHFGTDYMYHSNLIKFNRPIDENTIIWNLFNKQYMFGGKINKYGLSKLIGVSNIFKEMYDENEKKTNFVVIVVSWLYSEFGNNFVKTMYKRIENHEHSDVVCTQLGSPTYGMDVAYYVIDMIENNDCCFIKGEPTSILDDTVNYKHIINFSGLGIASWYDIAKAIEEHVFGTNFVFPKKEPFDDIYRPSYSVLDTEKVCRLNRDKEYLSHWTYALKECVEKIA